MVKAKKQSAQDEKLFRQLKQLLDAQQVAVLASHRDGQPYCSLVTIVASSDLKSLAFATTRSTRKFQNLLADPRVALMIDDREHLDKGLASVTGVTVIGKANELPKKDKNRLLNRYLKKHPHLVDFVLSPNCAFLRVRVSKYVVVDRFQHVLEIEPR